MALQFRIFQDGMMSSIEIEKALYRIIQGRLRYKSYDGLVLYIYEPTPELIYQSHEIYDEAYDEAYKRLSLIHI